MITLPRSVRVWAYGQRADLRKGYNGLGGLVKEGIGHDVMGGDLFLFVNIRRTICKVILWDGTDLCIFMKRLERGRFANLWSEGKAETNWCSSSKAARWWEVAIAAANHAK